MGPLGAPSARSGAGSGAGYLVRGVSVMHGVEARLGALGAIQRRMSRASLHSDSTMMSFIGESWKMSAAHLRALNAIQRIREVSRALQPSRVASGQSTASSVTAADITFYGSKF